MAAVMAGGMVPPLAIALATTFFKNRFTKEERDSGKVNYVMGLSFVTEGAIPFAAGDPLHVIPACVGGSAVAGMVQRSSSCTSWRSICYTSGYPSICIYISYSCRCFGWNDAFSIT
ncbi:putative pTS system, fructose-specific, IIABC component [Clostridioides difficile DA00165]|nr:putative pTS system, fructose-specific, IIABC component [Clostridioides difficile DA00165]